MTEAEGPRIDVTVCGSQQQQPECSEWHRSSGACDRPAAKLTRKTDSAVADVALEVQPVMEVNGTLKQGNIASQNLGRIREDSKAWASGGIKRPGVAVVELKLLRDAGV